jgi:hypothetical protein
MAHYKRKQGRYTVEWHPDNESAGYDALVESAATDIQSIEEAKNNPPVFVDGDDSYKDVLETYRQLTQSTSGSND